MIGQISMNWKNGVLNIGKVLWWTGLCWFSTALCANVPGDSLTLLFAGDLMQHKAQIEAARTVSGGFDYSECFKGVKDEIKSADLAVGNLEVPLGGKPYTGYPAFSAPDEWLYAIRDAGFNVLLTANNHCLDRRKKGLERTIHLLDSLDIPFAGTYRNANEQVDRHPLVVEKNGFKIAFLNYTYGTNGIPVTPPNRVNFIDREQIRLDILKARWLKPDVIIACMHWGLEYRRLPEKAERELAEWMISLGVDHIVGAHPHVIQPVEVWNSVRKPDRHVVAYSLGNFVSNMSQIHTDGGMILKLILERKQGKVRLKDCGYAFVWTSRPNLNGKGVFRVYSSGVSGKYLNESEKTRMNSFLKHSRELLDEYAENIFEYIF